MDEWELLSHGDKAVAKEMLHVFGESFLGKNLLIMNTAVAEWGGKLRSPTTKMTPFSVQWCV